MELSIIIVNWNVKPLLEKALLAIQKYPPSAAYEVLVVDNASADGSIEMVRDKFPGVTAIANQRNLGFAGGNNVALKLARGNIILLLNPDTEVQAGALQTYIDFFKNHTHAGAVGVKLLNSDGSLQRSCKSFPSWRTLLWSALFLDVLFPKSKLFGEYEMTYWDQDNERLVDQPMGAALGVRKEVVDKIGLMDEQFYMYFDEVDWCYRIKKAGYEIWFTPIASIIHHWGKSTGQAQLNMNWHWYQSLYRYLSKNSRLPKFLTAVLFFILIVLKILVVAMVLGMLISVIVIFLKHGM
jgi:GT2 family glycosyltransferase